MNSISKKSIIIFLIINIFLASCGVKSPEVIIWSTDESDTEFSDVQGNPGFSAFESEIVPTSPTQENDIPWDELLREGNQLNCTQQQIKEYKCFGDINNGYKCIDGTCYAFYSSKVYVMPEGVAENYKERILFSWIAQQKVETFGLKNAGWVISALGIGAMFVATPVVGAIIAIFGLGIVITTDIFEEFNEIYEKYKNGYDAKIDLDEIDGYQVP